MTATDELRRMLDGRGVEWTEPNNEARSHTTYWTAGFLRCAAVEFNDGMVSIASSSDDLTPEQAVEATLGRGTCRVVRKPVSYSDDWKESLEAAGVVEVYTPTCSECGAYIEPPSEFTAGWNYCPNCGRRIEGDA